jgi:hypothetical protein
MDQINMPTLTGCCMKSKMKKFLNVLGFKKLTNREALMFCIYQTAFAFLVVYGIVLFQFGLYGLILIFGQLLSGHIIILMNTTFNILIMFQFIDRMNDLFQAVLCKCEDYYDMPVNSDEDAEDEDEDKDENEVEDEDTDEDKDKDGKKNK